MSADSDTDPVAEVTDWVVKEAALEARAWVASISSRSDPPSAASGCWKDEARAGDPVPVGTLKEMT